MELARRVSWLSRSASAPWPAEAHTLSAPMMDKTYLLWQIQCDEVRDADESKDDSEKGQRCRLRLKAPGIWLRL